MHSDPFEEWGADPDFERLGWHLRAELRAEAEEYERLAAVDALRGRRLGDVALELLHRGDVVAVDLAGRSFTGAVVYTAGDLLCVRGAGSVVDVNLEAPLSLRVVERVRRGGAGRSGGPPGFKARLFEHEAAGTLVEIGCRLPVADLSGRIRAVAVDHLVVDQAGGDRRYVALRAIDYVVARDG
jgi:hypothetical protein